jgi:hypothetical protein
VEIKVEGGELVDAEGCFLAGPLEEDRRDRIVRRDRSGLSLVSFTALRQQIDDYSQKAVVLKLRGTPSTKLTFALDAPRKCGLSVTLGQLAESSEPLFTGEFPHESALIDRVVFEENYKTSFAFDDVGAAGEMNWYYARVTQANGQMAWSSPIWVEKT